MRQALAAALVLLLSSCSPAFADPIPGAGGGGGGGGGPETDPIYNLEKGSPGGAATLDGSTKVPLGQLPEIGPAQIQDAGVDSVKLSFGPFVGGSTTFAGLPAAGSVAKDGDWAVLHADDGLTQAGLYELVSGVWTLRLVVPEGDVLAGATPPGSCSGAQVFVENDQVPPLLYGCVAGVFELSAGGGGSFTPDADPEVDHSGFDAAVAGAPATAANTAHAGSTSNPHAVTAGQVGALASGHPAAGVTDSGSGVVISGAERSKLAGIEAAAKDDQVAAEVPVTAVGNLASTQAQQAFEELQSDIDALVAGGGTPVSVDGGAPLAAVNLDSVGDVDFVRCTGAGAPDSACQAADDVILRLKAASVGWLAEIFNDLGCGALAGVRRNAGNSAWECFTPGAGGGGDELSVGGTATTDPDLRSEGDLAFVLCTGAGVPDASCLSDQDVIARVKPDSVALGVDTTGGYAGSATEGGPATTALALDANPSDCPAGQTPSGIAADGSASGCVANAEQAELDAHTSDLANPHGVTTTQAGAEPAGAVSTHAALPGVHHAAPISGAGDPIDGTTSCARVNQRYQNTSSGDQFYCVAVGTPAGSDWEPWPDIGGPDASASPEQPTGAAGAVGAGPAHAFEDHRHPTPTHAALQSVGVNDHHTPPTSGTLEPVEPTGATGSAGVSTPYSREDHRHPTPAHGTLQGVGSSDHHTQTPDQVGTVNPGEYCQGGAASSLDCDVAVIPGGDVAAATESARGTVELAADGENAAGVAVQGDDARLSDARAPTAHAATHAEDAADQVLVENLGTAAAAGTAPLSDGAGGLDPVDVATQAELNSHSGDTGNPHAVTAVQAGAEPSGSVATHAALPAAHHEPSLSGAGDPVDGTTACPRVSSRYQNTTTGDQFYCVAVGSPAGSDWEPWPGGAAVVELMTGDADGTKKIAETIDFVDGFTVEDDQGTGPDTNEKDVGLDSSVPRTGATQCDNPGECDPAVVMDDEPNTYDEAQTFDGGIIADSQIQGTHFALWTAWTPTLSCGTCSPTVNLAHRKRRQEEMKAILKITFSGTPNAALTMTVPDSQSMDSDTDEGHPLGRCNRSTATPRGIMPLRGASATSIKFVIGDTNTAWTPATGQVLRCALEIPIQGWNN